MVSVLGSGLGLLACLGCGSGVHMSARLLTEFGIGSRS